MRRLIAALALACAPALAQNNMVAKSGADYVRLTQADCHPEVARLLPPELVSMFKAAHAVLEGRQWKACWVVRADANVLVVYSDGDLQAIPIRFFSLEEGV